MLAAGERITRTRATGGIGKASPDMLRKGKWTAMKKRPRQTQETAELLAIQALAFIAEDPERMAGFLGASGIAPDAIRDAASTPGFLAGVLEHMLADESLLLAFADSAGLDPAEIAQVRRALGGKWERDLP
jgi:hypothetical protein